MLFRRVSSTFLVRGTAAIASLVLTAVVIRAYSLGKFGEFSFALMTAKLVAAFALFSLDSLLLRLLLRGEPEGYRTGRSNIVLETGGITIILSCIVALILMVAALIGIFASSSAGFWVSLLIMLPIIPLQNSLLIQASLLRFERRDALSQLFAVGVPTALPVPIIGLAWLAGYTLPYLPEFTVVACYVIAFVASVAKGGAQPFRRIGPSVIGLWRGKWRILRYSSAVHSANMMNYVSDWYGTMLIAVTQSMEVTGALRVIQQFGSAFHLVSISVEIPLSTEIARAHVTRNFAKMKRYLLRSQVVLTGIGGVLTLMVIVASETILRLFEAYSDQTRLALILFVVLLGAKFLTGAAASALNLMDATRRLMRASAYALAITIALQSFLVPLFGIVGAAAALGAGVLARGATNYMFVRRELKERLNATKSLA